MNRIFLMRSRKRTFPRPTGGFTLVELMVALTISLLILGALIGIFVNTSRSHNEMAKTNGMIENGRFAIQLVESDLVHAGYWGGYIPQFDDLRATVVPGDVPTAVPDPCQAFGTWNLAYNTSLLGIPVQTYQTLPTGAGCVSFPAQRAGTDVLVVRHMETCVPGVNNCAAAVAGRLYFQTPLCPADKSASTPTQVVAAVGNTIQLAPPASTVNGAYVGMVIRTATGTGAGQYRVVTAYNGATRVATLDAVWTTIPDNTTTYAFEYLMGTGPFPLTMRDCATAADQRRFMSGIYYITNVAHLDRAGEWIPTLVRSQFDFDAATGTLAHQAPVPLIEGVEQFRVELGIDNVSRCAPNTVNYGAVPNLVNRATCAVDPTATLNTLPLNRGDGAPDVFVRCTDAAPCTAAQLTDVVAVKLYLLVRSRDTTPGYTDTKSYCLGESAANGTCPAASVVAAANDSYKRHVFTTSVRLVNISARRETP